MPRTQKSSSEVEPRPLAFRTTKAKGSYVRLRAKASNIGHTQFLRAIFNDWLRRGAPPITDYEHKKGVLPMPPELIEEVGKGSLFYP